MGHDHHREPMLALAMSFDEPLHEVAAEKRAVAAGGSGLRAAVEFAYSTAVVLDPASMLGSIAQQMKSANLEEFLDVVLPFAVQAHDDAAAHTHTVRLLASAAGQLTGAESALRSAGCTDDADTVAAAHLAAADAFFAALIKNTTPQTANNSAAYDTILQQPVQVARQALKRSAKAHKRARPTAAAVLRAAAAALF